MLAKIVENGGWEELISIFMLIIMARAEHSPARTFAALPSDRILSESIWPLLELLLPLFETEHVPTLG